MAPELDTRQSTILTPARTPNVYLVASQVKSRDKDSKEEWHGLIDTANLGYCIPRYLTHTGLFRGPSLAAAA